MTGENGIEISEEDLSRIIKYFGKLVEGLEWEYGFYKHKIKKGMKVKREEIQKLEIDKIELKEIGKELKEIRNNMKMGEMGLKMVYSLMRNIRHVIFGGKVTSPKELLKKELKDDEEYLASTEEGPPSIGLLKEDFQGIKILVPKDIWKVLQKEIKDCQRKRLEGFYELLGFKIKDSIIVTAFYKPKYTERTPIHVRCFPSTIPPSHLSDTHEKVIVHVHPIKGPSQEDIEGTMGLYRGYFLTISYDDKIRDIFEGEAYKMPAKSRDDLKEERYKIILF